MFQDEVVEPQAPTFINQVSLRIICDLVSESLKALIVSSVNKNTSTFSSLQEITAMLDNEVGEAILSCILGLGLPQINGLHLVDEELVNNISHEFIIQSGTKIGKNVIQSLVQYFIPVILESIKSIEESSSDVVIESQIIEKSA